MTTRPAYLEGDERLERWDLARRTVRMGSPEALAVGDLVRARQHALAGRGAEAKAYVEYMHPSHLMMIEVTYEWCLRAVLALAQQHPEQAEAVRAKAEEEWKALGEREPKRPELAAVSERLSASWLKTNLTQALKGKRSKMLSIPNPALTAELEALHGKALEAFAGADRAAAVDALEKYYGHARAMHDALIEYLWAIAAAVSKLIGEEGVDQMLAGAFKSVPAVNVMWPALHAFGPADAAFFLAEHLRGHFSGPGREGGVTIVDEPDKIRLVFDPCGSGGAVRRKAGPIASRPAKASSWGLADVPPYCTHCAHNERRSIETIGFPRWVTEYDPDPSKPCGWTIYKKPEDIPARYFERLGFAKDPAKFKKTGHAIGKLKAVVGSIGVMMRSRK